MHVRSDDRDSVAAAVRGHAFAPAFASGPARGWISVYPKSIETQDQAAIERVGVALSAALDTSAIAFVVHDSDVFAYALFARGATRDRYDSAPGYFTGDAGAPPSGGDVDALLPLCVARTRRDEIERLLRERRVASSDVGALDFIDDANTGGTKALDNIVDSLRANYPKLRKLNPAMPELDEYVAQIRARYAAMRSDPHVAMLAAMEPAIRARGAPAEALAEGLARMLGLSAERALATYRGLEDASARPRGMRGID